MKKDHNVINKNGFVLLETVIVSVFIISIFTFIYLSVIPLLGKYDELAHDYDIEVAYKLYHIRDAIYKDANFNNIVSNNYKVISSNDFIDTDYYNSLTASLFKEENNQIIYIRKLNSRADAAIQSLGITGGFKQYIKKIASSKTTNDLQNFIFINEDGNYAYLGLGVNLNDVTNYTDPEVVDLNNHKDQSGANKPLLMDGMIPVYYNYEEETWLKADLTNKSDIHYWYDYDEFRWGNVVLVKEDVRENYENAERGTLININDVLAFYVWIPRYEYTIEGTYGKGSTNVNLPGEISVKFITKSVAKVRTINSFTWRTPTAFTFGNSELDGFWFAKFEMSNSELKGYSKDGSGVPYVLPETYSWTGQKIAQAYQKITTYMNGTNGESIYGLKSGEYTSDAHVMKNDEWGAVAYLSQSKYGKYGNDDFNGANKEVYINNRRSASTEALVTTGSSAGKPSSVDGPVNRECATSSETVNAACYKYYVDGGGTGASTTGTIYGVYDMSGGVTEIVMGAAGATKVSCGTKVFVGNYSEFTGFKGPYGSITSSCNDDANDLDFPTDEKYYQIYLTGTVKYGCSKNSMPLGTNDEICYSHAMGETSGWYGDVSTSVSKNSPWYVRGGLIEFNSGIFALSSYNGSTSDEITTSNYFTTRPIIAIY